jgi:hypothetical protein
MANTMASHNINLSSWVTLYKNNLNIIMHSYFLSNVAFPLEDCR